MSWSRKAAFVLSLLVSCGYQLVGKETHLPPGITSIAVPTFVNQTYEPGIEVPFTQAFLADFIRDRRVTLLEKGKADSVLEGRSTPLLFRPFLRTQQGLVNGI